MRNVGSHRSRRTGGECRQLNYVFVQPIRGHHVTELSALNLHWRPWQKVASHPVPVPSLPRGKQEVNGRSITTPLRPTGEEQKQKHRILTIAWGLKSMGKPRLTCRTAEVNEFRNANESLELALCAPGRGTHRGFWTCECRGCARRKHQPSSTIAWTDIRSKTTIVGCAAAHATLTDMA